MTRGCTSGSFASPGGTTGLRCMSAMPPIAHELMRRGELTRRANTGRKFEPRHLQRCAKTGCNSSNAAPLFDHLVGAGEQRRRHFEAERLRRFQIDDQLELRGLLDGQIARLCPFEDLVHKMG
jgi:hypothetical protein